MSVVYAVEPSLGTEEFVDVLRRSTLAARRPADDADRIKAMLKNADLIVTARNAAGVLIGVARSVTDFSYCCYLSDLAVDEKFQGRGIGKQLIEETRKQTSGATLILIAAPKAVSYYQHIGMEHVDACYRLRS